MQTAPSIFAIVVPEVLAMQYGYIRVSSKDQNVGRQLEALREKGFEDACIFMDKQSGKALCF